MLPGHGILIDTPGMREIQLWETGEGATATFAGHRGARGSLPLPRLRPRDRARLRRGGRGGQGRSCPPRRLDSYRKLRVEQAHQHRLQDQRAQLEGKRRARFLTQALTRRLKDKGR